jgi:cytochrome b subunit of formate dehydrogenase
MDIVRAAALGALLLYGTAALASDECTECHDTHVADTSAHDGLDCQDCHSNLKSGPHEDAELSALSGPAICAQCHDADPSLAKSVHNGLDCTDCHGDAHTFPPLSDLSSPMSPVKQINTCGGCHDAPELTASYLNSVHARALLVSGLVSAPACSSCHGAHDILPPSDPDATTSHARIPQTCGTCHALILDTWKRESIHGAAWKAGREGPVCTTCHDAHDIVAPTTIAARRHFPEDCGRCHEEALPTFRDSFHGKATELGYASAAICSDCHLPHRVLPPSDPRSSVHPDNLATTCGKCHDNVTAAFLTFDPHNDPRNPNDSRPVYYVWFFMTGLLFSVFGFFGVHTILWMQRSAVGLLRGEIKSIHGYQGPWVRRFARVHVWTHVTIVVTFLLLAATGLPLKFHDAAWAQTLVNLFGGVDTARVIHRLAAIGTFGYAAFHLGYLFLQIVVQRKKGMLWGTASLMPQPRDIADLFANLRYFLYLGPRPSIGRWTYWEKFDYLAVFWGVIIIGVSGLILWFPEVFAAVLPGWALNAAYVVHSDEALLAVGFIFLFHFFHTDLRPEGFPMDPVIFLGRMPLERLKDERPLQYQRMVDDGTLEAAMTPAPTRSEIRRAYAFGFTAMAIGIALAVAIFWALLAH